MSRIVRPDEGLPLTRFQEPAFGDETDGAMRREIETDFTTPANLIQRAEREAAAILAQAEGDADAIRRDAHAEGRTAGEQMGREDARHSYDDAIATLGAVVEELRADHERFKAQAATDVIEVALAIVRRVLGDYVDLHPDVMRHIVGEALRALPKRESVVVRVHPSLVQVVRECKAQLQTAYENATELYVVADEAVTAGGCVIDTESVSIDATVAGVVERLRVALHGGNVEAGG